MFAKIPKKTIISVLHWHCYWIWMEWTKLLEIVLNLGIFWQRYLQEILQVFGLPLDLNVKVFLRKTKKERSTDIGEMLLLQQMWDFWPWPDDMRNVSHLLPPFPTTFRQSTKLSFVKISSGQNWVSINIYILPNCALVSLEDISYIIEQFLARFGSWPFPFSSEISLLRLEN